MSGEATGGGGNGGSPAAGAGGGGGDRGGLLWRLGALLRRREAESVRERVEALVEGGGRDDDGPSAGDGGGRGAASGGGPGGGASGNGGGSSSAAAASAARAARDELDPAERALLGNVLRLRGKTAYDVMVPRADIVAMPATLTLEEAIRLIQREGHSRMPVYRDDLDDVVGMVHIKDVFAAVGREGEEGRPPFDLAAILRKPLLVVPGVPVLDLLLQMRQERIHLALVVDEYGGIDGLVTIEDLVETIVGDIADEHDEEEAPRAVARPDGSLDLDGRMTVGALEERLGRPVLTDEERGQDIDTVAGLVFTLAGRVPARGELVSHPSGLEFRVLDSDPRRIRRLRVRAPTALVTASDGSAAPGAASPRSSVAGRPATPSAADAAVPREAAE